MDIWQYTEPTGCASWQYACCCWSEDRYPPKISMKEVLKAVWIWTIRLGWVSIIMCLVGLYAMLSFGWRFWKALVDSHWDLSNISRNPFVLQSNKSFLICSFFECVWICQIFQSLKVCLDVRNWSKLHHRICRNMQKGKNKCSTPIDWSNKTNRKKEASQWQQVWFQNHAGFLMVLRKHLAKQTESYRQKILGWCY